eukprot:Mycagemm_TRINITY_DN9047_c0_g1::TRINITY_DN9047_c0_g1_i1::g.5388::m.5388 type:complete len:147 gc:universal TRINITY_DN9047_c0_g1_i1:847-407(-)
MHWVQTNGPCSSRGGRLPSFVCLVADMQCEGGAVKRSLLVKTRISSAGRLGGSRACSVCFGSSSCSGGLIQGTFGGELRFLDCASMDDASTTASRGKITPLRTWQTLAEHGTSGSVGTTVVSYGKGHSPMTISVSTLPTNSPCISA